MIFEVQEAPKNNIHNTYPHTISQKTTTTEKLAALKNIETDEFWKPSPIRPNTDPRPVTFAEITNRDPDELIKVTHGGGVRYIRDFLLGFEPGYNLMMGGVGIQVTPEALNMSRARDLGYTESGFRRFDQGGILYFNVQRKFLDRAGEFNIYYEAGFRPEFLPHILDIELYNTNNRDVIQAKDIAEFQRIVVGYPFEHAMYPSSQTRFDFVHETTFGIENPNKYILFNRARQALIHVRTEDLFSIKNDRLQRAHAWLVPEANVSDLKPFHSAYRNPHMEGQVGLSQGQTKSVVFRELPFRQALHALEQAHRLYTVGLQDIPYVGIMPIPTKYQDGTKAYFDPQASNAQSDRLVWLGSLKVNPLGSTQYMNDLLRDFSPHDSIEKRVTAATYYMHLLGLGSDVSPTQFFEASYQNGDIPQIGWGRLHLSHGGIKQSALYPLRELGPSLAMISPEVLFGNGVAEVISMKWSGMDHFLDYLGHRSNNKVVQALDKKTFFPMNRGTILGRYYRFNSFVNESETAQLFEIHPHIEWVGTKRVLSPYTFSLADGLTMIHEFLSPTVLSNTVWKSVDQKRIQNRMSYFESYVTHEERLKKLSEIVTAQLKLFSEVAHLNLAINRNIWRIESVYSKNDFMKYATELKKLIKTYAANYLRENKKLAQAFVDYELRIQEAFTHSMVGSY